MKQFIIETNGTINYKATAGTPEKLYGSYDDGVFQVHFSESEPTKAAQITALSTIFDKATCGKIPQRIKQHSKNIVGFALMDEPIATKADAARQSAFNELKAEAFNFNNAIKAAQASSGSGGQNPPTGGQNPPPKGGQNPPTGGQNPPAGGGQFDKTKDVFGRPLKQAYPGLFQPNMTPKEEEAACDEYWAMVRHVDKDIFGKT